MTEEGILKSIDAKLDAMVRLFASSVIEGKTKTEAIIMLGGLGLTNDLIAELVKTTPATVSARLSEVKRKGKVEGKKITRKVGSK
jgi:DNA-binding CsgD family transcriptional regulator